MSQAPKPRYPQCRRCPFYLAEKCLMGSSRILLYFYCPESEGFRGEKVLPTIYKVAADSVPRLLITSDRGANFSYSSGPFTPSPSS